MQRSLVFLIMLVAALALPPSVTAMDYSLSITGGEGDVSDTVTAVVSIDMGDDGFSGLQFAVCHDSDLATVGDSDITLGDLLDGEALGFEGVEVEEDSWRAVVMVDLLDPTLTIDTPGELYEAVYTLDVVGTCDLDFCGDGLNPPGEGESAIVVMDSDGNTNEPVQTDAAIQIVGTWSFTAVDVSGSYDSGDGSGDDVVVEICIEEDETNPSDNGGFQGSVAYDDTYLELVSVDAVGDLADLDGGAGPAFMGTNLDPENGTGFTVVVIYSLLDPSVTIDYTGGCNTVLEVTYSLVSSALTGEDGPIDVSIEWDDDLSTTAVPASIVVEGDDVTPNVYDGIVSLSTGVNFLRGDADGNGIDFPILDALYILDYGFNSGPVPPCLDAADADGNNVVFPIIDALWVLDYGFNSGPAPPDPGPSVCGPDPDDDTVTCETPSAGCA